MHVLSSSPLLHTLEKGKEGGKYTYLCICVCSNIASPVSDR